MLFSYPAFLWGLLAVLIPIAVHLFNFRRYRKVYFSNVERLSELHSESRRRSTVRQWLVLLLRILAVVFLVLAFAQPVLPSSGRKTVAGSTVVSIYIDNSFSMESASSDGSQLDAARQKAREVAATYGVGDRYQLLTNDMTGSQMRWLNRDELLTAIDEVALSPASPMLSEVVARQSAFMRQSGAPNRHAYLISDFQRSTADLDALPADSNALFTLVPLTAMEADNVYIDTLSLDAPAYFAGGSVNVDVTLRNGGSCAVEKVPVKLYLDGKERALATLDLAPGASGTATLRFSLDRAGWVEGRVEIDDYPVTFDDHYYFALHVGERIHMIEVDGKAPNESLKRLFAADSAVVYSTERHLPPALDDCSFMVLNEVERLTSGEERQLAEWVAEGGSLLLVPSADNATGLNTLLATLQAPQLERWVKREVRASAVDYGSSLYRGVFSGRNDEMEMPAVHGHYTHSGAQAVKQSVIALADGGELLTLTPFGNGKVYLFTTPLTAEWTDLVQQALFVPTLYNMALYSRPLPPASYTLGSDEPIVLEGTYDLPELTDGQEVRFIPDLRKAGNRQQLVLHGELTTAGIYRIDDERLAFNYPRRESDLAFLSRDEVARGIAGRAEYTTVRNSDKPLGDELRARDGGRRLWRLCVLLALLALAGEVALLKVKTRK
ncbi:MAG: BatA domain-containing protein [Bacteroidales bacterium]|nr:BatA domain-containing protein [Bacteroidales bacterium]